MILEATEILSQGNDLTPAQMEAVMGEIMTGKVDTQKIVSFLKNLNEKGETSQELSAAVKVMRRYATKVQTKHEVVLDTCGTGGDKKHTFNISTTVAFVASGAGIAVAKHGNRSVSSKSGSADVLEALGVNINMPKEKIEKCLDDIGIAFLFAQNFHPAMKYAMQARREIAAKTIFNFLGPLSNPANARYQLVGVYDNKWAHSLAYALKGLDTKHALVVHGRDNMDEVTTIAKTLVYEVREGKVQEYEINPEDFGFKAETKDLVGGTAEDNAKILLDVLSGQSGPHRDIVILNAAAAIYTADKTRTIKEAISLAEDSIDSGKAKDKLERLIEFSNR